MKRYEVWQGGSRYAASVAVADSFWTRFRGLMLRRSLEPGEGLLLRRCASIHCFFMRFPIDVVYLDRELTVVGVETVKPWRIGGHFRRARHVLELEQGKGAFLRPGMTVELKERETE